MRRVWVPREVFRDGALPEVCAKTGRPADRLSAVRASRVPGWTFVLILFGVLPFLVAAYFARERVDGWVPFSDEAIGSMRSRDRVAVGAWVVAGVLLALAITVGRGPEIAWLALGAAAVGVGAVAARAMAGITARPDRDGVVLSGVHRGFADAVDLNRRLSPPGR